MPAVTPLYDVKAIIDELETAFRKLGGDIRPELLIAFNLWRDHLDIPALGLKQCRDISDPSKAAFQSIVEAGLGLKKFRAAALFGDDYSFILNDLATHPVAEEVGLAIGPQDVSFAFWLYADMVLGAGTTNWTSGQ